MPHGGPDFNVTAGAQTTYRWADLDELAARLDSPVTYDRRGDVILIESFKNGGLLVTPSAGGAGSSSCASLLRARTGALSWALTHGAVAGDWARIQRSSAYPVLSNLGVELSFTRSTWLDRLELRLYVDLGATELLAACRYRAQAQDLQYLDGVGGWTTVAPFPNVMSGDQVFHTMKVVGDFVAGKYCRVLFNSLAVNLAGKPLPGGAWVAPPLLYVIATAYGAGIAAGTCYVDDMIITQNEPA